MNDVTGSLLNKMPVGAIAFDQNMSIIYCNGQAELFFKRHKLPDEMQIICRRIFDAIRASRLRELFPGEIYFHKKVEGSPSNWTFRFHIWEQPPPFVAVFITEETVSGKIDLNRVRSKFALTRRETDVLRRVLDGLKNIHIADELGISEQTVKDHLSNIYLKIGVENRFLLMNFLLNMQESQFG
jgi:DNA-binding CsgD family transcriptional regulator